MVTIGMLLKCVFFKGLHAAIAGGDPILKIISFCLSNTVLLSSYE